MTFTFDQKLHAYTLDGKPLSGVTTVLGTIGKPALVGWAAQQTAKWIRENCSMDGDVWLVHEYDLAEAVKAHNKSKVDGGKAGTSIHQDVEHYIKECIARHDGFPLQLRLHLEHKGGLAVGVYSGKLDLPPTALVSFVNWAVANNVKFEASEKMLYSREWWVAGTADFTCVIAGKRYVGDLKTMKKVWDRTPHFQTAAYMKMLTEMGEGGYDGTVIVNINKESNELTEHYSYDWQADQKAFEACLTIYRQLQNF